MRTNGRGWGRSRRRGSIRGCAPLVWRAVLLLVALGSAGCAALWQPGFSAARDVEVYRRADAERLENLQREIERLRADLREAEEALVAAESGLRGAHIRADAVSALAQARIEVERAAKRAPWRGPEASVARAKLEEAERQLNDGHIGSAIFFASRASRIASTLLAEAERVQRSPGVVFVRHGRANLRAGPSTQTRIRQVVSRGLPLFPERKHGEWLLVRTVSGQVGWVHATLLR